MIIELSDEMGATLEKLLIARYNYCRANGGHWPDAFILPKRLEPDPIDGYDTDEPATVFGLPIIWSAGDDVGIFIRA